MTLDDAMQRLQQRVSQHSEQRKVTHRADVAWVQQNHPELAEWLTEMAAEFGRREIDYRVVLK